MNANESKPATRRKSILAAALIALAALTASAAARDGYGDRPLVCDPQEFGSDIIGLAKCQVWISRVERPDNLPDNHSTCCGIADSYIADGFRERDGKFFAIITRDYPNIAAGTEIEIHDQKINRAFGDGGNPSGHGVVFMNFERTVFCYFGLTLG